MEFIALIAMSIGIVATGMATIQSNRSMTFKVITLGLLSWAIMFTWNGHLTGQMNSDHGIIITIFTIIGATVTCVYVWPHLPNDGAKAAVVFGAIILIVVAGYPTFIGKLSQPTISSTTTSQSTPRTKSISPKKKVGPSKEDCEKMSFSLKKEFGCQP